MNTMLNWKCRRSKFVRTLLTLPLAALALPLTAHAQAQAQAQTLSGVPDSTGQVVVCVADGWNSDHGKLQAYSRQAPGAPWKPLWDASVPVMLGKNGLAWGNGLIPVPHGQGGIPSKREKDTRAPAGMFRIGTLYGYAPSAPAGARVPYYQVTARDCWIDNPDLPDYNRHVVVDPSNPPPWYAKERMRLGDFAYEFLLEVRHNADPPRPNEGSAIFFHIRRGPKTPTHGCTTMARRNLVSLITWIRPQARPLYVLLPKKEYQARQRSWSLPPMP